MKDIMRKIFSPILNQFESGENIYAYKKSHRQILVIVGLLFLFLSGGSLYASINASELGGLVPIIVFLLLGIVCEVVGLLGTDKAVANIWKSK